ncbi:expressed unknown protein [Seminavis robusta]|uniref:DUF5672 domain-containing protein n=1 Tax=Seminavis robusta TaxID=568900 RepID=A0A9N8H1T3_9STRA|nr:expressed unknown protein [Seminavis robusta]|eukprot:Sro22_g015500.1 n/a (359) ;mRNA; f:148613-149689
MKSFLNSIPLILLLVVTVVQWALISYLLQERHHDNDIGTCPPIMKVVDVPVAKQRLDVASLEHKKERTYDGVAAAIFFSAPAWFQRRFPVLISNVKSNTPPNWAIQLFVKPSFWNEQVLPLHPGLPRLLRDQGVIIRELPERLQNIKQPNQRIPLDPWFWNTMVADRVFMFSGNGILCTHGNTEENWKMLEHLDYCACPWTRFDKQGGDSATHSYRNRTIMLRAIEFAKQNNLPMNPPEGMAFVEVMQRMNTAAGKPMKHPAVRLATRQDTIRFGGVATTNSTVKGHKRPIPPPPMVVSGTQAQLTFQEREDLLMVCPELKVIFPSLHEPACFGAKPNPEKCKATICALKDKLPGSGC